MSARSIRVRLAMACALALAPAAAAAQRHGPDDVTDVLVRIEGPLHVPPGDTVNTVGVIGDRAVVEGTVREQLFVVDGEAVVQGVVEGNVVVVGGRLVLRPGARIGRDVFLYQSTLDRAPDAVIEGTVRREFGVRISPLARWLFWLGMTVAVIAVGVALAAVAGRQLSESAHLIPAHPGPTLLTALVVIVGLPALAFASFFTLVGIPIGLALLFLVLPALALVGYVVAGTALGGAILRRGQGPGGGGGEGGHPYLDAALGIGILQLIGLVPVLGGLVAVVASQVGAGALVYRSWLRLRSRDRSGPTRGAGVAPEEPPGA